MTRHAYAKTNSAVRVFDYDVANNTKVRPFLQELGKKKRQNYKMTSSGVGCRFWVYAESRIALDSDPNGDLD